MKRSIFIVITTIILLISIPFHTIAFAASMPTTTITSVKAQSKAFTVKWKKKSGITGYQIQYSTNSKFKKNNKKIKIKNAKTVSKKITGLNPTQKYYVRIRTYKGKKYSSWSKKKCIIVENSHCTNNNNHSIKCGNMGKWFNSRSELVAYYNSEVSKWNKKIDNEEITYDEYYKNVPSGYESWSCSYCGKWTGNFKYN